MKTRIYKNNMKHWVAESKIILSDDLILEFITAKHNDVLLSSAKVLKLEDGFLRHALRVDYYIRVVATRHSRITEKAVKEQHESIDYNMIIEDASKFYKIEMA